MAENVTASLSVRKNEFTLKNRKTILEILLFWDSAFLLRKPRTLALITTAKSTTELRIFDASASKRFCAFAGARIPTTIGFAIIIEVTRLSELHSKRIKNLTFSFSVGVGTDGSSFLGMICKTRLWKIVFSYLARRKQRKRKKQPNPFHITTFRLMTFCVVALSCLCIVPQLLVIANDFIEKSWDGEKANLSK